MLVPYNRRDVSPLGFQELDSTVVSYHWHGDSAIVLLRGKPNQVYHFCSSGVTMWVTPQYPSHFGYRGDFERAYTCLPVASPAKKVLVIAE